MMTRTVSLGIAAALFLSALPARAVEVLPALSIDPSAITVSGVSSGGYMAHQFHLAHASSVSGAAVIAGGPYHCAGGGYPTNLPRSLSVCMDASSHGLFLGPPNLKRLLDEARERAESGAIDALSALASDRVFLFSGGNDALVPTSIVQAVGDFYFNIADEIDIEVVTGVPAAHAMVTSGFGDDCDVSQSPFMVDCGYDLAGEILEHLHGPLQPAVTPETVTPFDQASVVDDLTAAGLDPVGFIYVPQACREGTQCGLHIAFHGCLQNVETIGDTFANHAGYNGWAEANGIVVLYPQTQSTTDGALGVDALSRNPAGCWDWWGYTGEDYHLKSGPQIRAIKAMVDRLAGWL